MLYTVYGSRSNVSTSIFYGVGSVILDDAERSMCYGGFMKPFNADYSNFFEVRIAYLRKLYRDDIKCRTRCSNINVDYFISDDFY